MTSAPKPQPVETLEHFQIQEGHYLVRWRVQSHWADFSAVQVYDQPNGAAPAYQMNGDSRDIGSEAIFDKDPAKKDGERGVYHGFGKWDGCTQFDFENGVLNFHFDDADHVVLHVQFLAWLWKRLRELLPGRAGPAGIRPDGPPLDGGIPTFTAQVAP